MQWQFFLNVPIEQIHWFHHDLMVSISKMDHIDNHVEPVPFLIDVIDDKSHLKEDEIDHLRGNA
jgi:hypothetical protein